MDFLTNLLKLAGIVFLRFRPLPRVWCVWLVGVNLGCLYFIAELEAQVLLAVTVAALVAQTVIYGRSGFTRLLGVAHLLWLPMFAWMATRLDHIAAQPDLQAWLVVLAMTNAVSFLIDVIDVTRFLRGERAPHYSWA